MKARVPTAAPSGASVIAVKRAVAVRLLGVSDRTFARLESEGIFSALKPGVGKEPSVYDAAQVVAGYLAHKERKWTGSNEAPRDRKDRTQAELNELRLERERGALVPLETVSLLFAKAQAVVRASIMRLPVDAIQQGLPIEHEGLLRDIAENTLLALANSTWENAQK